MEWWNVLDCDILIALRPAFCVLSVISYISALTTHAHIVIVISMRNNRAAERRPRVAVLRTVVVLCRPMPGHRKCTGTTFDAHS